MTGDPYRDRVLRETDEMYANDPSPWWRDDGWKGLGFEYDDGPTADVPDAEDLADLARMLAEDRDARIAATLARLYPDKPAPDGGTNT